MSDNVVVRRAERADLEALYEIELECFREEAFPRYYIASFLDDPDFITLVITVGGEVVGYVVAKVDVFMGKRMGHIYSIAVKQAYRRMGLGSRLLRTVEEALRERGAKVCYLEAREDNIAAINFYHKHGYRVFEVLKDYYGDGKDGIRFMKIL